MPRATAIYSSELLDKNTCGPCTRVDGHRFVTLEEARAAYPYGIYRACEGGPRCRGTLVVVWEESNASRKPLTPPGPNDPQPETNPTVDPGELAMQQARLAEAARIIPAHAAAMPPGAYIPGVKPSDILWQFRDGWAELRSGNVRVRKVTSNEWEVQILTRGKWSPWMRGIWARVAELPMTRGLLPPGYNWPILEQAPVRP